MFEGSKVSCVGWNLQSCIQVFLESCSLCVCPGAHIRYKPGLKRAQGCCHLQTEPLCGARGVLQPGEAGDLVG